MAESVGQPTKMTEATLKLLDECFANGATDIQACFIASISTQTLYNYQHEHPEYVERKQALKDMIAYQAKIKVKSAIDSEDKPDTAKWYLERKDKEFKNKNDITTDGKAIPTPIVQLNEVYSDNSNESNNSTNKED